MDMAPYKIIKQGYMQKEPPPSKRGLRKKLHRYWFVLVEDKRQMALVYFKTEEAYISRQRNEGFIRVDDSESVDVLGEHLGNKHSFAITTPKGKYILVPESRYDLHEWIMTLHTSLESFQKRQQRAKARQGQRSRASSTSEARAGSTTPEQRQRTTSTSGARPSGKTTPTTPTRRAPPPPIGAVGKSKSYSDSLPRKKPARPAPAAPFKRRETVQVLSPTSPPHDGTAALHGDAAPQGTSPEGTMPPWQEQPLPPSLFGAENSFGPEPHAVLDLDTRQTEPDDLPVLPPEHFRSSSDSPVPVPIHQKTHSLPDLTKQESSSPEAEELGPADYTTDLDVKSKSPHSRKRPTSMTGQIPTGGHTRHTRHLSLLGEIKPARKKRASKRQGSIKRRSRSPPNLPPPPPPPDKVIGPGSPPAAITAVSPLGDPKQDSALPQEPLSPRERLSPLRHGSNGGLMAQASASLGFSEVMSTISNIDQQLDQLGSEVGESPPRPSVPVPVRSAACESNGYSTFLPIQEHPEESEQIDFSVLDSEDPNQTYDSSDDALGEHGLPMQAVLPAFSPPLPAVSSPPLKIEPDGGPMSPVRTTPDGASSQHPPPRPPPPSDEVPPKIITKNLTPSDFTEKEVTNRIFYPEETGPHELAEPEATNWAVRQPTLENKEQKAAKPATRQHRVMFKEEVEDIPLVYDPEPSYEPDPPHEPEPSYEPRVDEEIPSTVAELKRMLFGEQESGATRYKKEGSQSPRHNRAFDYPFEYHRDSSLSPNISNSNPVGEKEGEPWPDFPEEGEEKNLYDMPWEKKAVSKYRVVGHRKKAGKDGGQKEAKETLQFAEVSTHEAPKPGSMEVRNVHSLERPPKKHSNKSHSLDRPIKVPTLEENSLLESISSTLQGRGKFGSDSLLTTIAMEATAATNAMQTYSPPQKRMANGVRSSKGELEKIRAQHRRDPRYSPQTSPKTAGPQKPAKRVGLTQSNGQPRMAVSWDELQRDPSTQVSYDSSTRSHVFRSLV